MFKSSITLEEHMLSDYFDAATLRKGRECYQAGSVIELRESKDDEMPDYRSMTALVKDSSYRSYTVGIEVYEDEGDICIEGTCACRVAIDCKHVVATLLFAIEQDEKHTIDYSPSEKTETELASEAVANWFNHIQPHSNTTKVTGIQRASASRKAPVSHLVYVLNQSSTRHSTIDVELKLCRVLQKGGYGKAQDYRFTTPSHQSHLQENDEEILVGLQFLNRSGISMPYNGYGPLYLNGRQSSKWLEAMIQTERCFFKTTQSSPMSMGKPRPLQLHWEVLPNACQKLMLLVAGEHVQMLMLDQLWYLDEYNKQCERVQTDITMETVKHLLNMPPIPPEMIESVSENLKTILPEAEQQLPKPLEKPIFKMGVEPIPEMRLNVESIRIPAHQDGYYYSAETTMNAATMEIAFDYDGRNIPFSMHNKSETITYIQDGIIYTTKRNFEKEKQYLLGLKTHFQLEPLSTSRDKTSAEKLMISSIQTEEDYLDLVLYTLPQLELDGWRIFREHEAFTSVIYEDDVSWYSELEEASEYDYFGFKMGILVGDEKINMLPIVAQILKNTTQAQLNEFEDEDVIPLPLPNGRLLSVPYSRIKPMLNILIELYDTELTEQDVLKLSKHQAALLFEIQKAFGAAKLRWFGGEKLRTLGKKLSEFKTIKTVKTPKTFKTTLRNYQQDGVNWLQFLREYQMGGILADDMGLGKTVQTLAHLSIEKNRRRLQKPSLIIAPTSLMVNWRQEAEKFTPNLKVLVFHGDSRHEHKESIPMHDIVLTTYPLLVRDKEVLLNNEFYYLILDEAQFIKNHKAKSTLVVQQLKAEHRLCVTGTPMENHLGELWSLFHFLMPGFLGDSVQFKRLFRTPIEKRQDNDRRKSLALRVKPFMLRRQKTEVLTELPDKTEIIRTVELQGPERDLYESIRLSMEKKVRDAIKQNGLSRSHIIILDALLKLRQICCHSRLLKLTSAKKAHKHSSKLALLKDMLPNMVEEGRKILVFSQFTQMLAIIEEVLTQENINYVKLTGSTKNRTKPIETFQQGKVPVFLISLKAGGTGLNLTTADTVIHYDPWWNPAVEDQATDRAHRMGQKKSLFVYKLIAEGTVEETIQEMQQKKRALVDGLFSEQQQGKLKLSTDDLSSLFKPLELPH